MAVVETVKIVSKDSKDGYMVINKSDLERGQKVFDSDKAEKEAIKKAEADKAEKEKKEKKENKKND